MTDRGSKLPHRLVRLFQLTPLTSMAFSLYKMNIENIYRHNLITPMLKVKVLGV